VSTDYNYHCSVWPPVRITGIPSAWFEAVLSGFQRTESNLCQKDSEEFTRCIAIVREFENMMSFMWEWQTEKQAYGLG
jgi:hypothetical protein